jgi:hypothetical protein
VTGSAKSPGFTRPIDYNPKRFLGTEYTPKALALAHTIYADAQLVSIDLYSVDSAGNADVTRREAVYQFRSPSHSVRPKGAASDAEMPCEVTVSAGATQLEVRVRSDDACKRKLRFAPKCSVAEVRRHVVVR